MPLKYLFYSSKTKRLSIVSELMHDLSPTEVMRLLIALGNKQFYFARAILRALSLPMEQYRDLYAKLPKAEKERLGYFECSLVREYFLLSQVGSHFSSQVTDQIEWGKLNDFSSIQHLPRLLCHASSVSFKSMKAWENILSSVSVINQMKSMMNYNCLSERLIQLKVSNPENVYDTINRMNSHLSKYTSIVLTFNPDFLNLNKNRLYKNFFQTHHRGEEGDTQVLEYLQNRMLSEILLYSHAGAKQLLQFAMFPDEHPCYATLQQHHQIEPIHEYGNSFVVFDQSIKDKATAFFGAPLTKIVYKNLVTRSNRLNESLVPLLLQFSDQLLMHYAEAQNPNEIPAYNKQFCGENSEYIEVQFPANMDLQDGKVVKHIHIEFGKNMLKQEVLNRLQNSGIIVTIDKNPFQDPAYLKAFNEGYPKRFITDLVAAYIYQVALFIGETSEEYLRYSSSEDALQFTFNVTINHHGFHQAQAAGLLYTLGVRDYFKKQSSAIDFVYENFTYKIPLNFTSLNEGSIFDHDSYCYHYASLVKLLNKLLLKVLSTLLICQNNEDYVLKHGVLHPVTGKGSTEESLLLRDFYLMSDGETIGDSPVIRVNWLFDCILIEAVNPQPQISMLFQKLLLALTTKIKIEKINFNENFIVIRHTLPEFLKMLNEARYPYQANIIHEELSLGQYGDLLLAYRYGYTTPGGHNNDPYSWIGAFSDIEFGKINFENMKFMIKNQEYLPIDYTINPKTIYYSSSTWFISDIKEDEDEFLSGSLDRFPLHKLGQLSDKQVEKVAGLLNLSVAQYRYRFGSALPLRSLPAIYVYIEHYRCIIEYRLEKLFCAMGLADKAKFRVRINASVFNFKVDGVSFDLPYKNFGRISINGKEKHVKILLKYLLHFTNFSESMMRGNELILTNINPLYFSKILLLNSVFNESYSFSSNIISCLIKKEFLPILYLSPEELMGSFYEILRNNTPQPISLKEVLKKIGLPLFQHILSGFMIYTKSLIENKMYNESAIRNDALAKKYIAVLRRWMLTRWDDNKITLYDFICKIGQKDAIAFLQYNPFLHAVKKDPISGVPFFNSDKAKWYQSLDIKILPLCAPNNVKMGRRYGYDDLSCPRFFVGKHPITYQALYAEKDEPGFLSRRASF